MADAQVMEAKREAEARAEVAEERAEAAQLQIEQLGQWRAQAEAAETAADAMTVEAAANTDCTNDKCGFSKDGLSCWANDVEQEGQREVDGGRWQRMSPWATGGGLLIRLRMSSFVFTTSLLAGASALATLSITSFAFLALSCLRFNVLAVPYGVFPNVVSPFV